MHRTLTPFLLVFFLPALPLSAQVSFGGHPYGDKAEKRGMPAAAAVHLPVVDVPTLMDEDAARAAQGIKGPFRFGFTHATDFTLQNSGSWWTMPNGDRVWRLMLLCPGALGINLQCSNYVVPQGARLFLYNEAGEVRGGYTAQSNPGHTALGTAPLSGDRITVEYIEPASLAGQGQLTISGVTHEYRTLGRGMDREYGDSGPCNVNTICPEGDDWRPEIRAVAHVILGGGECSGTLLNNCANDSTPYFLTANHCTQGNETNATWVFVFNWESPVCDPTQNVPMDHTVTGCDKLLENPPSDASFLRLSSIPPANFQPYFGGWDMSGTAPTEVHCIHHPSGDIKKISSAESPIDQQNGYDAGNGPADCWHVHQWASGTTEPGSSGSALWDQHHRIIGQLYGGEAACGNSVNDYFGRFDITGPLLAQWLGACGDSLDSFDPGAIPPMPLDAAITSIFNVDRNVCGGDSIVPHVSLKNDGVGVITFANINYSVDGVPMGVHAWGGLLLPVQTVNVALPAIHLPTGQHTLRITVSDPDHEADVNPANDADSTTFILHDPGIEAIVEMDLDRFGSETTWTIATQAGFIAYTGGPFANSPNGYVDTTAVCLGHDCYIFTMYDALGDGMCCDYGNGHYLVRDTTGAVLLQGDGSFGTSRSDTLCMNWVGIREVQASPMRILPNPSNGQVTVRLQATGAGLSLTVLDALGRTVWTGTFPGGAEQTGINLSSLSPGTYLLTAAGDRQRYVQRLVIQR